MAEPVMCCGGTCVRALCEYHKDVPLEVEELEPPTEPVPVLPTFSEAFLTRCYGAPTYFIPWPKAKP